MDQQTFDGRAAGAAIWTMPFDGPITDLATVVRNILPILPQWSYEIRTKWEEFGDRIVSWFGLNSIDGLEDVEEWVELLNDAADWSATQGGFDLWDEEEGLPSYPSDIPPVGGGDPPA